MEILQTPLTPNHKSAMFFDGVIAREGNNSLVTLQDGELVYYDKVYVGEEIKLLIGILNDETIEDEVIIDILVDKFFVINYNGVLLIDYLYDNYDEALSEFVKFNNMI
jgi:hypothetical protein